MPAQSISGMNYPEPTDSANAIAGFKTVADSHRGPVPVASLTAADTLLAAYNTLGDPATNTRPVYVHRLDKDTLEVSTGTGWRQMTPKAGRGPREIDAGVTNMNHAGTGKEGITFDFAFAFSEPPSLVFSMGPSGLVYSQATSGASTTQGTVFVTSNVARNPVTISWQAALV